MGLITMPTVPAEQGELAGETWSTAVEVYLSLCTCDLSTGTGSTDWPHRRYAILCVGG